MDLSARGKKRRCLECDEAFYDLNRDPAPCPYCGHAHPIEAFTISRRPATPAPAKAKIKIVTDDDDDIDVETDDEDVLVDDDDDDAIIGDDDDLDDDDDAPIPKVSKKGGVDD